ncbi:uncharacterized protein IL334_000183 [Kwoniella shivajii]|uniref:Elongation factor 1-gamma n=1 Tax=Kwoniella shivajii TaxID=564305 RepID=A0ABZ1CNF2_9TREE|nr:hypothetical protein IL334_000183 [Kwoniella shivajii]
MAPRLTGFSGNSRLRRVRAAAALAGVELEWDSSFSMKSEWKTEEFIAKNPFGFLPTLELEDGTVLRESGAIAEYVAELGANSTLVPSDAKAKAEVHEWQCTADQELFIPGSLANRQLMGVLPYNKPNFDGIVKKVNERLAVIDSILVNKTFLVGERITLADIFTVTALTQIFSTIIDAEARVKIPNVIRYFETLVNHPKLLDIFNPTNLIEKVTPPAAPAKEQKPKADKPKEAKAPKPKKEKEVDEEEEEPLVPAEPKVKNPLDDLPKSAFNLEEWKRQYSNLDTRGANGSLEWFYEKFDREGFSIWRVDFKYNEELTQVFMSSNQVGGFFNRLEASRKYLFGSVGVLGKANDSIISGAVVLRGQDIEPVINVAPDWESYSYKKLDVFNNEDDKKFFEGSMAWDLIVDGKEWADGKNFK